MRTLCLVLAAGALTSSGCATLTPTSQCSSVEELLTGHSSNWGSSSRFASLIATIGLDLWSLKDRANVQATFGTPSATGEEDGRPFDEYITRRKVIEPWNQLWPWNPVGPSLALGYALDCSQFGFLASPIERFITEHDELAEVLFVPCQLYLIGQRTLLGQRIRFTYDADGKIYAIKYEGDTTYPPSKRDDRPSFPAR